MIESIIAKNKFSARLFTVLKPDSFPAYKSWFSGMDEKATLRHWYL